MPCPLRSPLVWASSVEGPALAPSGHLPVSKQHRVCQHLRREVDGEALSLRPFMLVLGSSLRCETWPGHERTASCQPHGSCDKWWLVSWAISNPERWCCESAELFMPANLKYSALTTGLEKISFIPIPKKSNAKECAIYHTIALFSYASNVQNSPSQASAIRELWTSRCSRWI